MIVLIISIIISFFTTFIITPFLIRFLYFAGIVSFDLNKKGKPKLPASGGICVASGILAGILVYVGLQTFIYGYLDISLSLLAVVSSILIVTFTGLLDDLNVKSKAVPTKDGMNIKIGFPQWLKPLMTLPAAVPLMVISAGDTTMYLPFIGNINFGILYPLLLIPIGVVGVSNMVNMLGGFNGLEAGMGLVYTFGLGLYAFINNIQISAIIFFSAFASLLAFLKYNWYPARILPGDSLTYLLGSAVVAGIIIGNMEKAGIIVMIPFLIQGALKFYSHIKLGAYASDLGVLQRDGTIKSRYGKKIYSWTHLVMNMGKLNERQIALILIFVQVLFCTIPFLGIV